MTDAMLAYRKVQNPSVAFALINAGGIRATIDEGDITRGEVLTSFPFGNAIVEISISGEELWKTLEGAVSKVNQFNGAAVTSAIQVSKGINITYNPRNAVGSRLISVDLTDGPLSYTKNYTIVTLDFLAGGMFSPLIYITTKLILYSWRQYLPPEIRVRNSRYARFRPYAVYSDAITC
jgi:2',3'-cyclic-nucleotide 2'-phosphodiesterase (5'-nucleotidase family)